MAPHLTPTKRTTICVMRKAGYSNDEIRAALTGYHDISNKTIGRVIKKYGEKENYYETAHDATDLQKNYFPDVSVSTMKRALRQEGLESHIRATVPFISNKNLGVRKKWAKELLEWKVENWRAVHFSDESIFHLFGSDGVEWCWRRPGQRLDPRFTKKKVKHGGGKVAVWGMITPDGVGRIVRIEGNLTGALYREILQDDMLGTYDDLSLNPHDFYFQQDNDPKHKSHIAMAWFKENNIDLLPWPPNSPDINIIENLWGHLGRRI
ncbi:hypothetical protein NLJ89_g10752 [Agrocybe chaxingu]|uniref:Tc1-like transposase DDE domain-containing protein n=1 Tax=Agrocybe chaxingu TaxID=84603 RepID=A0A9W8MQ01_9AGAR|nr:hypothetical protein NLJ89_g10752 [Agrocybe chaxingu]